MDYTRTDWQSILQYSASLFLIETASNSALAPCISLGEDQTLYLRVAAQGNQLLSQKMQKMRNHQHFNNKDFHTTLIHPDSTVINFDKGPFIAHFAEQTQAGKVALNS